MRTDQLPIHSNPEIMGATPVFVGTRVPVQTLLDYLEAGDPLGEFLDDFPSVSREQAIAVLELARRNRLEVRHGSQDHACGLLADFEALAAPDFDPRQVHASVIDFHFRSAGAARLVCQGRLSTAEWKRDSPHAARSPSGRLVLGRLGGAAVPSGHSGLIVGR